MVLKDKEYKRKGEIFDVLNIGEGSTFTLISALNLIAKNISLLQNNNVSQVVELIGVGDGSNTVFNITKNPYGNIAVYVDGKIVSPTEYSVNSKSIIFTTAPASGIEVVAVYMGG